MRKEAILLFVCFIVAFLMQSCDHHRNSRITDVTMQRIEIEDSMTSNEVLYIIEPVAEYSTKCHFLRRCHCQYKYGSIERIDSIYLEDISGKNLNGWAVPKDSYHGHKFTDMVLVPAEDTLVSERIVWNMEVAHDWTSIREWLQQYDYRISGPKLLSISKSLPMPENIVIRFADRSIRAKVNNEPKHYKIKNIILEQQYDE